MEITNEVANARMAALCSSSDDHDLRTRLKEKGQTRRPSQKFRRPDREFRSVLKYGVTLPLDQIETSELNLCLGYSGGNPIRPKSLVTSGRVPRPYQRAFNL